MLKTTFSIINDKLVWCIENSNNSILNPLFFFHFLSKFTGLEREAFYPLLLLERKIISHSIIFFQRVSVDGNHLFSLGCKMKCHFSIINLNDVWSKTHLYFDLYAKACEILIKRGLSQTQTHCIMNNFFLVADNFEINSKHFLSRCETVNLHELESFIEQQTLQNGQSPSIILNRYYERVCQNSLNVKHKHAQNNKTDFSINMHYPAHFSFDKVKVQEPNKFYYISQRYIVCLQLPICYLKPLLSKHTAQCFLIADNANCWILLCNPKQQKKFEAFVKRHKCIYSVVSKNKTVDNLFYCSNLNELDTLPFNNWYWFMDFLRIDTLNNEIVKFIKAGKPFKFAEFYLQISSEELKYLLQNTSCVQLLYLHSAKENDYFCISIYFLNTLENILSIIDRLVLLNRSTILYTNIAENLSTDSNFIRHQTIMLLFMKQTGNLHPYPTTYEEALLLTIIKIKYSMAVGSKLCFGSKHKFEGPLTNILSERGLLMTSDVDVHDKFYENNTLNSSIFFNVPSLININNKNLPITFDI